MTVKAEEMSLLLLLWVSIFALSTFVSLDSDAGHSPVRTTERFAKDGFCRRRYRNPYFVSLRPELMAA